MALTAIRKGRLVRRKNENGEPVGKVYVVVATHAHITTPLEADNIAELGAASDLHPDGAKRNPNLGKRRFWMKDLYLLQRNEGQAVR